MPDRIAVTVLRPISSVGGSISIGGSRAVRYKMNKNWPNGHISEWPVGVYHEAHRHRAGAILHGLNSSGYVLAWPAGVVPVSRVRPVETDRRISP